MTEIGEKGITLSGGQKARVSLARAAYANKEIIVMDDPVSALDTTVKKKIFSKVFQRQMAGKTRILVTHAVDFMKYADRIIVMKEGEIILNGSFDEAQESEEVQEMLKTLKTSKEKKDTNSEDQPKDRKLTSSSSQASSDAETSENEDEPVMKKAISKINYDEKWDGTDYMSKEKTRITKDEDDEKIVVTRETYISFFK